MENSVNPSGMGALYCPKMQKFMTGLDVYRTVRGLSYGEVHLTFPTAPNPHKDGKFYKPRGV